MSRDRDALALEAAYAAVLALDLRYRRTVLSSPSDARKLRRKRDEAFDAFQGARVRLLEAGILSGEADLVELAAVREAIEKARKIEAAVAGAIRLVGVLRRFL